MDPIQGGLQLVRSVKATGGGGVTSAQMQAIQTEYSEWTADQGGYPLGLQRCGQMPLTNLFPPGKEHINISS